MSSVTRRNFLSLFAGGAIMAHFAPYKLFAGRKEYQNESYQGGEVGIYVSSNKSNVDATFQRIKSLGFNRCELYTNDYGMDMAQPLRQAMDEYNIEVLSLFTLGPGPTHWNFYEGQQTIGLVSRKYRQARIEALIQLSDLARACGIGMIETHVGFIPENPNLSNYKETVEALKKIVGHCSKNNQDFLYHAGQETPTTVLRTIQDVGYDNQGIGMDTANLIMYDRGHPYYALDIYGKYVKLVNAKDGVYPTSTRQLGEETQIGHGQVHFPSYIRKLKDIGYQGPVIIEREGAGSAEEWGKDVSQSSRFIQILLDSK